MADMERINVVWQGAVGLPGVSVFYGDVGGSANADIKTFFTAIATNFPTGLTWTVPSSGDLIDDATGNLTGVWVNAGGGSVAASTSSAYAAGVGTYVVWETSAIHNSRRMKGRTFLAPLVTACYDAGTIATVNLTALRTAASALVTAGSTRIWHRPVGGAGGSSVQPSAASIPDQVTSLATRRR